MSVYIVATLDTKGLEAQFLKDVIAEHDIPCVLVDVGCLGSPRTKADVPREEIFQAAGVSLAELVEKNDRSVAIEAAVSGVERWLGNVHEGKSGKYGPIEGVIAIGGSAGTTIGSAAMRVLPLGVPKLVVSTMASGQMRPYVRDKDIMVLNPVADIAGIHSVSRPVLENAASALAGMVLRRRTTRQIQSSQERPLIVASMFGVTTQCVDAARRILDEAGYETIVFHATGAGGQAMESLIREGLVAGVLDVTTTELADELVGGVLSAGPDRLTAASEMGIPQVVSVGATDMVNFGPLKSVPERFRDRQFYEHNASVTLMRTTPEECKSIGTLIGEKLADAPKAVVMLPSHGVSAIDRTGQPFDEPKARECLFDAIESSGQNRIPVERLPYHINDKGFAEAMASRLIQLLNEAKDSNEAD